ncbi:MAG: HIT family protein [candidate division KSB1 bacterium]|nr:HIT family protein [candidate division KSB1 bacterium]
MKECIFCKIARREIPAEIVLEDERSVAFLDIMPKAPGHTVVIPKFHAPTIVELPILEIGPLFVAVQKMAERLSWKLAADGLTIGINQGRASGQTVEHLHIHLLPRFVDDGGGSIHSVVHNPPRESLADIAKKLREGV